MQKSLRRLNIFLIQAVRWSLRHSALVVGFCLVLLMACGFLATRLQQVVSMEDQLDPQMTSTQELHRVKDLFGAASSLGFIVEPNKEYFSLPDLCLIQNAVNDIVFSHPRIEGFMSPYKIRKAVLGDGKLSYLRVLPDPCGGVAEGNPLEVLKDSPWGSVVTGREPRDFAVALRIRNLESPGAYGTFDPQTIDELIRVIQEKIPFKLWWMGTSAQQLFTMKGMAQSQYLNLAVVVIIALGMRIFFGTWRSGFIFLLTLFFTNAIVYGGMALFGHPTDPLSISLFLMITVASIEDFIFLSYSRMAKDATLRKSFYRMMVPGFFTSLTTVLGFGSLVVSDLQSIRHFGAWAATGSFVEWLATFIFLPAFMQVFPSWQHWTCSKKAWFYQSSHRVTQKTPPKFLVRLSLLVFIAAAFSVKHFRLSQTPSEMFPAEHPFQQAMEYIKRTRGWVADASLVFEAGVAQKHKDEILAEVEKDPLIVKVESFDQVVKFVAQDITAPLTRDLVGFEVKQAPLADRYRAHATGEERALLYLQTTNTAKLNLFREKVETLCPIHECWLAGEFIGFADFSRSLIRTLFDSLFLSLILIGAVIFYLCQATGKKHFFAILISAFWGPAVVLCGIYVFDLSVNFVTCIVASTLVGLTGDNAIQYLFGGRDIYQGIEQRGAGSIQTAAIVFCICMTLLGSYFEPPRTLGVILAFGFLFSLFGDLWILKALLISKKKPQS